MRFLYPTWTGSWWIVFLPIFQGFLSDYKKYKKKHESFNFLLVGSTLFLSSRVFYMVMLYTLWVFTIETWRVSIPDSCTFHLNLTCHNATNHCAWASIPLQHGSRGLQRRYSPLKDIVCKLRYIVANVLWRNDQTISISIKYAPLSYRTGGNRKRSEQSRWPRITDSWKQCFRLPFVASVETELSTAVCRQCGDKRQLKALFLAILDPRSSMVLTFSIASYLKCLFYIGLLNT